jgi:hypothetical protein
MVPGTGHSRHVGIGGGYINAEFQRAELVNLHRLTLYSALDQVDSPA